MEDREKEDYKSLKICFGSDRGWLESWKISEKPLIKEKQEKRLLELGYIDWDKNSKNLYHPSHILTIKGYEKFCELRNIRQKDFGLWGVGISLLISFIALLKSFGFI